MRDPEKRDLLIEYLKKHGVGTSVHFIPNHQQPYYRKFNRVVLPTTETVGKSILSLPIYPDLGFEKIHKITDLIKGLAGFIGKNFVKTLIRSGYRNLTLLDLNQKVFTKGSIKGIKGSFCDAALMSKILPGHAIIVHLAAVVGVHKALQEKDMLRQVNLTGTKQV